MEIWLSIVADWLQSICSLCRLRHNLEKTTLQKIVMHQELIKNNSLKMEKHDLPISCFRDMEDVLQYTIRTVPRLQCVQN